MGKYIRKKREGNYEKKFFINGTFDEALKAAIDAKIKNKGADSTKRKK